MGTITRHNETAMSAVPVLVRCTAFEQRRALPGLRRVVLIIARNQ
jgi:hypothetical protein